MSTKTTEVTPKPKRKYTRRTEPEATKVKRKYTRRTSTKARTKMNSASFLREVRSLTARTKALKAKAVVMQAKETHAGWVAELKDATKGLNAATKRYNTALDYEAKSLATYESLAVSE